jgi:hypothetical protein
VVITANLSFGEWATVFGGAKMTTTLLDRLTHVAIFSKLGTTASDSNPARLRQPMHLVPSRKTVDANE